MICKCRNLPLAVRLYSREWKWTQKPSAWTAMQSLNNAGTQVFIKSTGLWRGRKKRASRWDKGRWDFVVTLLKSDFLPFRIYENPVKEHLTHTSNPSRNKSGSLHYMLHSNFKSCVIEQWFSFGLCLLAERSERGRPISGRKKLGCQFSTRNCTFDWLQFLRLNWNDKLCVRRLSISIWLYHMRLLCELWKYLYCTIRKLSEGFSHRLYHPPLLAARSHCL